MKTNHKVDVPPGKIGNCEVLQFTVSKADESMGRIRAMSHGGRYVPAGEYTGLYIRNQLVMSDTPDEIGDHLRPIHHATGNVLINGLGIGVVLQGIAEKSDVTHVTVVEISQNVIDLVFPHYFKKFGNKIECICADAFEFKPPKGIRYNYVWHDIWDALCSDNLEGMKKLHRKYGRISDQQASWGREICEHQKQRGY